MLTTNLNLTQQSSNKCESKVYPYLIVNDSHVVLGWEGYGGDAADKLSHVLANLQLPVTRQRPQQAVHEELAHVRLQLVLLWTEIHSCLRLNHNFSGM